MDDIERIHKASAAKQLQNNSFLQEVFGGIRSDLVMAMETVPMTDRETQQAITLAVQVLKRIQDHVQTCIDDQKVHEFNLELVKQAT